MKGWKNTHHTDGSREQKSRIAVFIVDKIDFKIKIAGRDKEGHYLKIKGSVQQKDITIVNISKSNTGAPKYKKQILIKGVIDSNTIVEEFNTLLTSHQWKVH